MRKLLQRGAAASLVSVVVACGARTGLPVPRGTQTECVALTARAEIADLDVFIMLDSSGSMEFETAAGGTKWTAVTQALASFLLDPASAGIGAAMSFFPVIDPRVPEFCGDDGECGVVDACTKIRACLPSGGELCETDGDCAAAGFPDDTCQKIGLCAADQEELCLPDTQTECGPGLGACLDLGYCDNHYACAASAYTEPAVDLGVLPGAAPFLLQAVSERVPDGATPTLPALTGALSRAEAFAQANPSHKPIVVLATDGLPTVCDPAIDAEDPELAIQHLADAAAAAEQNGIQTFVVGVFAADEAAEAALNLDTIAAAGGTVSAFVISTDDDVAQRFLAALNEVRITAKSCEFAIPRIDGDLPDLSRLRVQITPASGAPVSIPRRSSVTACDPDAGGFYYDKDPDGPVEPGRIILCPASCGLFGSALDRTVDLFVSCDD